VAALNGGAKGPGHDLVLTAPQTGVVTTLAVALGQQVTDPTAVLMTVTNVDRVFVTANVPEDEVGQFPPGAEATVVLAGDPGRPCTGASRRPTPCCSPTPAARRSASAWRTPRPAAAGEYASVGVSGRAAGGVFVPQSALLMNNEP